VTTEVLFPDSLRQVFLTARLVQLLRHNENACEVSSENVSNEFNELWKEMKRDEKR
jgi:hypothetical protein